MDALDLSYPKQPSSLIKHSGACECGCGRQTNISSVTDPRRGVVKGQPRRFIMGHNGRKVVTRHYRRVTDGRLHLHRVRAENALGKPLPEGAVVHHADGSIGDNAPLVICQDQAYHLFLHARMRIVKRGGNPNTDAICVECRQVKPRIEFHSHRGGTFGVAARCKPCKSIGDKEDYRKRTFRQRTGREA